jgi:hypothetical protein
MLEVNNPTGGCGRGKLTGGRSLWRVEYAEDQCDADRRRASSTNIFGAASSNVRPDLIELQVKQAVVRFSAV